MKPFVCWLGLLLFTGFGTLAFAESKINPIKFSDTRLDNGFVSSLPKTITLRFTPLPSATRSVPRMSGRAVPDSPTCSST